MFSSQLLVQNTTRWEADPDMLDNFMSDNFGTTRLYNYVKHPFFNHYFNDVVN